MGVQSGKYGTVNGRSTVRNWQVSETTESKTYVASNTKGGTGRQPGINDWSGNFGQFGGLPSILPGETFEFIGYTAPDNGVSGATGSRRRGSAYVESVAITLNWENNDIVSMVTNVLGNGELITETGAPYDDTSEPDVPPGFEASIVFTMIGSDSGEEEILCAKSAVLTLTCPGQAYANSCTEGWRARKPGIIDWNLSVVVDEHQKPSGLEKGDKIEVRVKINDDDEIQLRWGQVKEFTNLNVNRETGEIISQTILIEMDGYAEGEEGLIMVGETQFWPVE